MDFLDPQKTRRNTIQLFTGYILVAIAIFLATLILIYYAYGFAVNRNGDLQQKGLVFVSSQPSGAQLRVNGKRVENTNAKLNLNTGAYMLDIKRDGYHAWQRSIFVDGGSVSHYVYPLLIPENLASQSIKTYETMPLLTTQSPDRRFLLALTDASQGTFDVIDTNKNQDTITETTTFSVPTTLMTVSETTPKWEVLEWSNNNRHMLLKRTYSIGGAERFEYLVVDRQRPEGSHNLSTELAEAPETVTLRDKKPDSYYIYNPSTLQLRTASLSNVTPEVVLNNVLAYKSHGRDMLLYVTKDNQADAKVHVQLLQDNKTTRLRTTVPSETYALDIARYDGDWYAVFGSSTESRAYIYKDPNDTPKNKTARAFYALRIEKPTNISFSANAQYILAHNATNAHVYDAEYNRNYRYDLPQPIDAPQDTITWMDGNRLTYVSDGKQIMFDYDNINKHILVDASPEHDTSFDQQYRYMYTFTQVDSGLTLSATPLRTEDDL